MIGFAGATACSPLTMFRTWGSRTDVPVAPLAVPATNVAAPCMACAARKSDASTASASVHWSWIAAPSPVRQYARLLTGFGYQCWPVNPRATFAPRSWACTVLMPRRYARLSESRKARPAGVDLSYIVSCSVNSTTYSGPAPVVVDHAAQVSLELVADRVVAIVLHPNDEGE